jgi:hypothetical protein
MPQNSTMKSTKPSFLEFLKTLYDAVDAPFLADPGLRNPPIPPPPQPNIGAGPNPLTSNMLYDPVRVYGAKAGPGVIPGDGLPQEPIKFKKSKGG